MANRAIWSSSNTVLFLQLLVEEKNSGNWGGKSATKKGYENVANQLRRVAGADFSRAQLKNKFDSLRSVFHLWTNLFSGQTGAGFDYATGNITMPDRWWDAKIRENEAYRRFRRAGLEHADLMYSVFADSSASGAYQYTPTAVTPAVPGVQSGHDETSGGDDTPPTTPQLNQDVSSPPRVVIPSTSQTSGGKRKRTSEDSLKTTFDSFRQIFSDAAAQTSYTVNIRDEDSDKTARAMEILYSLPNVVPGDPIFNKGLSIIMDKHTCNMFLHFRCNEDRVMWLRSLLNQ